MPFIEIKPYTFNCCAAYVGMIDGFAVAVTLGRVLIVRMPTMEACLKRLDKWGCEVLPGYLLKERRWCAHGTPFQIKVWEACQRIPPGQTRTYGWLAKAIECRSAQAVGQALGANPLAGLIPCHRVIAQNGEGGFAWGAELKHRWLKEEQNGLAR